MYTWDDDDRGSWWGGPWGSDGHSGPGLGQKMKRGPRGKFVSKATNTTERLVVGLSSSSGSGSSSGLDSCLSGAVGVGVDVRR